MVYNISTMTDAERDALMASLSLSTVQTSGNGHRYSYINIANTRDKLRFTNGAVEDDDAYQKAIFGLSKPYDGIPDENGRGSVEGVVRSDSKFVGFQQALDTRLQTLIRGSTEHWKLLTDREPSAEMMQHMYTSPLRMATEEGRSNLTRWKVASGGHKTTDVWVNTAQGDDGKVSTHKGSLDSIQAGCDFLAVGEVGTVWFISKRAGSSNFMEQCMVRPNGNGKKRDSSNSLGDFILKPGTTIVVEASPDDEAGPLKKAAIDVPGGDTTAAATAAVTAAVTAASDALPPAVSEASYFH